MSVNMTYDVVSSSPYHYLKVVILSARDSNIAIFQCNEEYAEKFAAALHEINDLMIL